MHHVLNRVWAYRLLLCLLVLLGIWPLLRQPEQIGQLYLGVPYSTLFGSAFWVDVEASSHWPGFQAGLRGGDRILALDGRSVEGQPQVFVETVAGRHEGDLIQVEVQRGARRLTFNVPLRRYRLSEALEFYGLWFLAGLTSALAGWLLFRPATALMALVLAVVAGLLFNHGYSGFTDPRFINVGPAPSEPIWSYGYALTGALLIHFAWRFPPASPTDHFLRRPISRKLLGLYGLAFALGTVHQFTRIMRWTDVAEVVARLGMLLAAIGAVSGLVRLVWLLIRREPGQTGASVIAGVWGMGSVLLLGAGIAPFFSSDEGMLLAQFLLSIAVIYPLLLVYAIRQVELVETLEHEVAEKQRWADLAHELQQFREEDLRRLANELHDTVLADLRAVGLRLESLLPADQAPPGSEDSQPDAHGSALMGQLQMLHETVQQIQQQAGQVVTGAMPLDFHTTGLREALEDALERFRRMSPDVDARLEVGTFDVEPPPAVREAAYWIAMSALNNCREHARASEVRVFASATGDNLQMVIRDNGVGFQGAEVRGRGGAEEPGARAAAERSPQHLGTSAPLHGLGLRNMRARAASVGGELNIESGPWGTTVRFSLAREQPIRVLVVEDSEAFVAGLRAGLVHWSHEVEIVGTAGDAQTALVLAQRLRPDVVLLDLRIGESPGEEEAEARHGLQALFALQRTSGIRSVVMSFFHDPAWLRGVAEAGAWAFWHKDQDVATLVGLLRRVMAGQRLLTPEQWAGEEQQRLAESLTSREWEVLLYLDRGLSNQEISGRLGISVRTVEKHVQGLREKLGARSRLEAVARARELGLLSDGRSEFGPADLADQM